VKSVPWLLLLLAVGACGPDSDQHPLLLLDAQARSAGYALTVGDWTGSPVTPIAVSPMDDVVVNGPTGKLHVVPRPGALGVVTRSGAGVTWQVLGKEVDADRFVVRGPEHAARELATALDAQLNRDGDERWVISGPEVLAQSAWMKTHDELQELVPEALSSPAPLQPPAAQFQVAAAPMMPSSALRLIDDIPSVVGVYQAPNETTLVLDASGGFALQEGCEVELGRFFVTGGTVVLTPDNAARRELTLQENGVLADNFSRFEEARTP
jgi:hypothetical protein